MTDPCTSGTEHLPAARMSAKLRAAVEYLGDKLSTHRASRFKPAKRYLLDEWLAARQAPGQSRLTRPDASAGD